MPSEFTALEDGSEFSIDTTSKGRISRYWNVYNSSEPDATRVKNNILSLASSGNHSFESLEGIKTLRKNISQFYGKLAKDVQEDYKKDIEDLISRFLDGIDQSQKIYLGFKNYSLRTVFDEDLKKDFPAKLACLMLIAATWFFWDKNASDTVPPEDVEIVEKLALVIFPYHPKKSDEQTSGQTAEEVRQEKIFQEKKNTEDLLRQARNAFNNNHDYKTCGDNCRKIISSGFVDPLIRGEAYYLLVKCRRDHIYKYAGYYDEELFLRQAISLGYTKASEEWDSLHMNSLMYQPKPSVDEGSWLVFNTSHSSKQVLSFLRTLPKEMRDNWHKISFICSENVEKSKKELEATVIPERNTRYLLLDNDCDKNFHDLLLILNRMRNIKVDWKNIEIFLRTREERYSALIDTALKHMDGQVVRLYLIDDAKWSAQDLLARHPLFYPIRSVKGSELNGKPFKINLNLLCNNDDLANWLIREAFWMSTFLYTGLTVSINVFSPEVQLIESRLRFECRGMWGALPDADLTSQIKIHFHEIPMFQSSTLTAKLNKYCFVESAFDYFIVAIGEDITNLDMGIRLREMSISKALHSKIRVDKAESPVIAYQCKDPDIAHLAKKLVVQQENHGDSWFNNYSLISFGTLCDLYHYDNLSGGDFERMAQSAHLQYCGVDPRTQVNSEREEALESYFNRCYNRDSSMSVALSIPYRLFQTSTKDLEHIVPTAWDIKNPNAFTDPLSIKELSAAFKDVQNLSSLQIYEHARWSRWMLTRGWSNASPSDTIEYMDAGNPKQQLYISRLHACLCSFDKLSELAEAMEMHYIKNGDTRFVDKNGEAKDFTRIDKSSLEHTADILQTVWFPDKIIAEDEQEI